MRKLFKAMTVCLTAMTAANAAPAIAQDYPSGDVSVVLPYNPGGIVDTVGRTVTRGLEGTISGTFVAINRPGAGGIVGTDSVVRSKPDGQTLLVMDPAVVILPSLQSNVPYDPLKDLTPLSVISSSPLVLVVSPSLPVKSIDEFISYAKENPGKMNFASAGIGTTPHLAGELFIKQAGIEATHIPYNGIGPSFVDLMAGKVQFSFSSIAGALPFTNDKRLIALATTGSARNTAYPDLPTVAEAGISGFDVNLWLAVFAPVNVDAAVATKLNGAINQSLTTAETKAAFEKLGLETRGTTMDEAAAYMNSEFTRWKSVIDGAGLRK
jgi:tripartite-type tricarboxylate transporter receptor subunit TctC